MKGDHPHAGSHALDVSLDPVMRACIQNLDAERLKLIA
jgi:hypothetical protein